MPEYTLKIRRFDPQSGEAAYWDEHKVEMREHNSVLDAILKVKARSASVAPASRGSAAPAACG
jgi:succinate dehydrogenase / fumarate reductase iron-sulfur subunit